MKLQGTPYIWGGSEPRVGFDCSGFIIWILQVFEVLPSGDWNANGLMNRLTRTSSPKSGDLCFYGKSGATHVMMYIGRLNGQDMCVGASGGGSETTTVEEAKHKNAQVKVKPVAYRSDFIGFCDIGLDL